MFPSVREALFSGNSVVTGPIGSRTQRSDLPGSCACPVVGSFTVVITDAGRSNSAAMHLSPVGSMIVADDGQIYRVSAVDL